MKEGTKLILAVALTAFFAVLIFYINAGAFTGPKSSAGTGAGSIGVNGYNNLSVGTSTTVSSTKLYILSSSTDSSNYALQIYDSAGHQLFSVRNDAVVGLGSSTLSGGSFNGTIAAGNVVAGTFGSNAGNGNFAFPAGLTQSGGVVALATTTITGVSTFKGAIVATGTVDTVTAPNCGTAPTVFGANGIGRVTAGTNASSSCTITFGIPFINKPVCVISTETQGANTSSLNITPTVTTLKISMTSSSLMKSAIFDYHCIGQ